MLVDDAAEEDARHALVAAHRHHLARGLPLPGRPVDPTLAGHDERSSPRAPSKLHGLQDQLSTRDKLGAERRQRGTKAAGRAGARYVRERSESRNLCESPLELDDVLQRRALLRSEGPGGAAGAEERISHVARGAHGHGEPGQHVEQARAAVDGRAPAEADEERGRALLERGRDQLAEAAARGSQRVELVRTEPAEPDGLRRLHDGGAIRKQQPARLDAASQRVRHHCAAPVAP